ncbi:hypothetical protein MXB_1236, partial [Myxobolus squamalis]
MADMNLEESLQINVMEKLKIRIGNTNLGIYLVERENEIEGEICFDPTFTSSYIFDDPTTLEPKSINEFLLKFLPNNTNLCLFKENLTNLPSLESIGKIIHTYTDDENGFIYETCHADFSDNEIAQYYMGIQILCLMYIDASSVLGNLLDTLLYIISTHFPIKLELESVNFLKNIMDYYCSNDKNYSIRVFEILKLNYILNNRKDEEKYRQEILERLNAGIS